MFCIVYWGGLLSCPDLKVEGQVAKYASQGPGIFKYLHSGFAKLAVPMLAVRILMDVDTNNKKQVQRWLKMLMSFINFLQFCLPKVCSYLVDGESNQHITGCLGRCCFLYKLEGKLYVLNKMATNFPAKMDMQLTPGCSIRQGGACLAGAANPGAISLDFSFHRSDSSVAVNVFPLPSPPLQTGAAMPPFLQL